MAGVRRRIERRTRGGIRGVAVGVGVGWIVAIAGMSERALALDEEPTAGAATVRDATAPAAPAATAANGATAPTAVDPASSWAYDLAGELMSPFCPGRTLASCPSPQAGELIQWIAMQEAAGTTRDEVVAILVERHGEEILGAPPARGIGLWAYLLPVLGFVGFGAVVALVFGRIVAPTDRTVPQTAAPVPARAANADGRPRPAGSAVSGSSNDELARIVDAELARRA